MKDEKRRDKNKEERKENGEVIEDEKIDEE